MSKNQRNKKGNEEGCWEMYHYNGVLYNKGNYINGVEVGLWLFYYGTGKLYLKEYFIR
jgi:antitoxin component YwqK of YwqJK toxin-antitoxin module